MGRMTTENFDDTSPMKLNASPDADSEAQAAQPTPVDATGSLDETRRTTLVEDSALNMPQEAASQPAAPDPDETAPSTLRSAAADEPATPGDLDETRPSPAAWDAPGSLDETMPTTASWDAAMETPAMRPEEAAAMGAAEFSEPASIPPGSPPLPPVTGKPATLGAKKPRRGVLRWIGFILLGLLALVLIGAMSAFGGYRQGIGLRQSAESTQRVQVVQEQFNLGVQEMEQGQYFRARQRFEYVIRLDPNYPGVTDKLALVLLELNTTATPTLVPTPTLTPTPDLRGVQELFDQGKQYLDSGDYTNAIDTLLKLRKQDPGFQAVAIDGMLFLALRNRGIDKIGKQADLEGGMYDLAQAERFGPLDSEAQGYQSWAKLYVTGASFWEIDWGQVVYYFSQVAPNLPQLRDGSGMSAQERYRFALIEYGYQLAEQKEWCDAQQAFETALAIAPDPKAEEAYPVVAQRCAEKNAPPGGEQSTAVP